MDFLIHLDTSLAELISQYGKLIYIILFAVVFVETGLVVMPFLPGDSLLFTAGAFAGAGTLNFNIIIISLIIAAIAGDTVNYVCGRYFGERVLAWQWRSKPLVNPVYIEKTKNFYSKYGSKTIVLARFVPIIRTVAPFVAGIGEMNYGKFITYNVIGGIMWVISLSVCGYYFGQLEIVKDNFEKVILGIIFISIIPIFLEIYKEKKKKGQ
ncbi:MAG: DedA family protein [Pseudomonadota bacterium]